MDFPRFAELRLSPRLHRICLPLLAAAAALVSGPSTRAQTVATTLTVGANPYAVAVNPVTNKIYVINQTPKGTLTVVDGATNAVTSIPVGGMPSALDINTVTNRIYVANYADGTVSVVDGTSNTVVATVATNVNPFQVVVNAKANHIYVMGFSIDGTEAVIDGATNTVVDQIFGGNDPTYIAVDPTTDMLYINAQANNDYPNTTVPTLYSALGLVPNVPAFNGYDTIAQVLGGQYVYTMAADPVTDKVVATCVNENGFYVFTMDAHGLATTLKQFHAGINYLYVAINSATGVAYITNGDGGVDAININTLVDTPIAAGTTALAIAVDPNANAAYVANYSKPGTPGMVNAIDGTTNLATSITVPDQAFALAVNPVTTKVYVLVNDGAGTMAVINGIPATTGPTFSFQPQSQSVAAGATVAFNAAAGSRPASTYQWTFNGAPLTDGAGISGSTAPTLLLTAAAAANAGTYAVIAKNSAGQATSTSATLSVVPSAAPGRIINLSTRARVDSSFSALGIQGAQVLIAGFVTQGTGSKSLVLRGIGPTLGNFGITELVEHPTLALDDSATPANLITQDMGWQSPPSAPAGIWNGRVSPTDATAADFSAVGAFALPSGSADNAIKVALPTGAYTTQITSADGTDGIVLAEVYDADPGTPSSNLVNISSRAYVEPDQGAMIAGFVVTGTTSSTLLIRASGPALTAFGVGTVLPNPNVLIYDAKGNLVASNTKWGGSPQIAATAARVGAFAWTDPNSQDAAVVVTLPPGAYTAEVNPTVPPFGNALIEVYLVP
jgi:YVTN family beta-propeller protein